MLAIAPGQAYTGVQGCSLFRGRVDVTVVVRTGTARSRRPAPFLVVLAASWAGTDGSTRNQLGGGPGLLVLDGHPTSFIWPGPSSRCAKRG